MQYVRQVIPSDVKLLADTMRPSDKTEIAALSGNTPKEALLLGVSEGRYVRVLQTAGGLPVGIFGAHWEDGDNIAVIWMLATVELENHGLTFLRHCRTVINQLYDISNVSVLWNVVDARNALHIKWLKWCGASFISKKPLGLKGEDFMEFVIVRKHDV
tara:strand:- start:5 stop:478 length:474 start_codon:yes stop_codon:yes gene_type:complete